MTSPLCGPGIERSIRTTSGCSSRAFCTSSTPSPASPATAMSRWTSSSMRSPVRSTAWSSAIRTLIGVMGQCGGNARADHRPMSSPRLDLHGSAQQRDALLHPVQAESRRFAQSGGRIKSDAVILDRDLDHSVLVFQHDANPSRLGVPGHVRQRLLQDPIHSRLCEWGYSVRNIVDYMEVDGDIKRFVKVVRMLLGGCYEFFVVQDGGM